MDEDLFIYYFNNTHTYRNRCMKCMPFVYICLPRMIAQVITQTTSYIFACFSVLNIINNTHTIRTNNRPQNSDSHSWCSVCMVKTKKKKQKYKIVSTPRSYKLLARARTRAANWSFPFIVNPYIAQFLLLFFFFVSTVL